VHIVIGVPAYTGTMHLGTVRSLFRDMTSLMQRGDKVSILDECDSCYLDDTRAALVAKFLDGDGDVLISIDHDVTWQADALLRLIDHPVDFCAGVYPYRKLPIEYPVRWLPEKELWADPETGLLEVEGAPGGFVKYSRSMLQRMVEAYSDLEFLCGRSPTGKAVGLFESYRIGDGHKLGDDYAFCRRWRDLGGKVWIDPEIKMAHVGNHAFIGHLGDWLRNGAR
jgi:hypothetical protein